ncbi:MAG: LamG domain-containing protein [Candidatus Aenigmarchaeota archaeon]|nr:LamG domain-containing protein [Candidatus Aenigmarchaeota archaeon]
MPGRKAVSSMIAYVLITLVAVTALTLTVIALGPTFDSARSTSTLSDAFQNMQKLDATIKGVASESTGSKRTVSLSVSDGVYGTNSTYDWLYYTYEPTNGLDIGGTKGGIYVESGLKFADYFNWYVTGSNAAPAWKNVSGQWAITDSAYSGQNGAAYHNVSGTLQNWHFSATITNVSAVSKGEVFALPTNLESLIGYWTLDEGSGGISYDYSGRNNTGTLTSMNTTGNATSGWQSSANCKGGSSCLMFDGVNDYVNISNAPNITGNLAISMWIYPLSNQPAEAGLLTKASNDCGNYNYMLYSSTSKFCLLSSVTCSWSYCISNATTPDQWQHVGVVTNGTHAIFYKNGAQIGTATFSIGSSNTQPTKIGLSTSGTSSDYFNGTIDEVMLFNRSLSANEMNALYETSTKKLFATGTQSITPATNVSIVLSSPSGQTSFDDVTVSSGNGDITLLVPYNGIDINGSMRAARGQQQIEITNMGINAISNKQTLQIKEA